MTPVRLRARLLRERPVCVDLFSGVGGLSLGLELAGFFSAVHVEIEECTSRYAHYNFPLAHHLTGIDGNVRSLTGDRLRALVEGSEISLIAGGPPCQGFSTVGRRRADDPLNDLVIEMARVVLEVLPKAFLIENVPGIKSDQYWQFGKALDMLAGHYTISDPTILKAEEFGVPQTRRRVFTIGIRKDLGITPRLPIPTHVPRKGELPLFGEEATTVADALLDIPNCDDFDDLFDADVALYQDLPHSQYANTMRDPDILGRMRGYCVDWDSRFCTNLRRTKHGPKLLDRLGQLEPGATEPSSRIPRLRLDTLAPTIRAGTTSERGSWSAPRPCHPLYPRVLTTRECARIQSFPDWFRFHPVKWHGNRQVGNAVPPLLARAVGAAIMEALGLTPPVGSALQVKRNHSLIQADIESAGRSNYQNRNTSHQVVNTDSRARSRALNR